MSARLKSFTTMTVVAVASAAGFWFLREHWQHARGYLAYLPYLLFLACPLMHLFMHHGHGHGHGNRGHDLLRDGRSQPPVERGSEPGLPR